MAASTNDKFRRTFNAGNPETTFVTATRATGVTTLSCDNLTGWPTDTGIDFVTYQLETDGETPKPGTQTDWKGIVSGNTITNIVRVAGASDTGNSVNDVVEAMPTGSWADDLVQGILESHNQDGTHKMPSTAKTTATATDKVLIDDGVSKYTTVAGLATAVAANAPANGLTSTQTDAATAPYGMIGFSTYGDSGGWASAITTEEAIPFDTVIGSLVEVTKPANGQLQVSRAGNYNVTLRGCVMAGSGNILNCLAVSTDGGTTWVRLTPFTFPVAYVQARGNTISVRVRLAANARVRAINHSTSNVRYAAANSSETATCSLTVAM